jgi:hypothetical protein
VVRVFAAGTRWKGEFVLAPCPVAVSEMRAKAAVLVAAEVQRSAGVRKVVSFSGAAFVLVSYW